MARAPRFDLLDASPTRRRLALAALLGVSLLTGLGHGLGSPEDLARNILDPEEPGCAEGTLEVKLVGNAQTGITGAPLGQALVLETGCLSRRDRNPTHPQGQPLQWEVTSGGGTIHGATVWNATVQSWQEQVHWQLGPTVGTQTAVARLDGKAYAFQATGLPPVPGGTCTGLVDTTGINFGEHRAIKGPETWTRAGSPYRGGTVQVDRGGTLTIEPGVQVCLQSLALFDAPLQALGTAAAPVRLGGRGTTADGLNLAFGSFWGEPRPQSRLQHVQGQGLSLMYASNHALLIEDSVFTAAATAPVAGGCNQVVFATTLGGYGPQVIRRTVFDGFGTPGVGCLDSAVRLIDEVAPTGGPSVFAARVTGAPRIGVYYARGNPAGGSWVLEQCEVSGSGFHGVVLETNPVHISGCSFHDNTGLAVQNLVGPGATVDARGNWWGSAAGPAALGGDGVSAGVDASGHLAAPPALGY
jgi:hypothetical protein